MHIVHISISHSVAMQLEKCKLWLLINSIQLTDTLIENGYNSLANHFKEILDQQEVNNNNNSNSESPYLSSQANRHSPYPPINNNNNNRLNSPYQTNYPFYNNKFQSSV